MYEGREVQGRLRQAKTSRRQRVREDGPRIGWGANEGTEGRDVR